jgi:hypothetical protein
MKQSLFSQPFVLAVLTVGVTVFFSACEMKVGDSSEVASPSNNDTQAVTPTPASTDEGGTPKPDNGGNTPPPDNGGTQAPGVPALLSPGDGESFAGSGKNVTFVWTDAEGAAQFEIVVQGLASGGWQSVAHQVTDNFQFNLTLNSQPYTQFRWAVRSIGADSQTSDFTGWSAFTWTP